MLGTNLTSNGPKFAEVQWPSASNGTLRRDRTGVSGGPNPGATNVAYGDHLSLISVRSMLLATVASYAALKHVLSGGVPRLDRLPHRTHLQDRLRPDPVATGFSSPHISHATSSLLGR